MAMSLARKTRPLSGYLKDFKYHQHCCAYCGKAVHRITLVYQDKIYSKREIARLGTPLSEADWQAIRPHWLALCRFCGELHYQLSQNYFDITGFWRYLPTHSNMHVSSIREYTVRLRRLSQQLAEKNIPAGQLDLPNIDKQLPHWLPDTDITNYIIAVRKYQYYLSLRKSTDGH